MTAIISSLRTYMLTCPSLASGALLLVDRLGETPIQYSIIPQAGEKIVESYVNGASLREFPFLFRSMESTADDLERIDTSGFYETLADWFEAQTLAGTLPSLTTTAQGKTRTAESIEATGWGYLYEEGQSETGIYQIQCKLTYQQSA